MLLAKKYWKDFSYFFSLLESEVLTITSSSSLEILLLRARLELTSEKNFSLSSDIVCSNLSEVSTKSFFRILCLLLRELYFSIISNRQALSSLGEKGESTSSSSSESDSASDVIRTSDLAPAETIRATAACSSSESPSSDSESSQVPISPFLFWNFFGFLSFLSIGQSILKCPGSLHSKQVTSLSFAFLSPEVDSNLPLAFLGPFWKLLPCLCLHKRLILLEINDNSSSSELPSESSDSSSA